MCMGVCVGVCMSVYMCVCERVREGAREREKVRLRNRDKKSWSHEYLSLTSVCHNSPCVGVRCPQMLGWKKIPDKWKKTELGR